MTSGRVWLVYSLILLEIGYLGRLADAGSCPLIVEQGRQPCDYSGISADFCEAEGCCWDEQVQNVTVRCYQKECKPGHFGWGCRFQCQCRQGDTCDSVTGQCSGDCPRDRWGVGCMLSNDCIYNDENGGSYVGRKVTTERGFTCGNWSQQRAYPGKQFPDGTLRDAGNFCRNPKPVDYRTWCYYRFGTNRKWDYCVLQECECMMGRWGINCAKECHCADPHEACGQSAGRCSSGCHSHWTGPGCQECSEGYFGLLCHKDCHCNEGEKACDRQTGQCRSGCAAGWTGPDCQTECADGLFGSSCDFHCNCKNTSEVCEKSDGTCQSGCQDGYSGDGCQIDCHCLNPLERCNAQDGSCRSGCAPGWAGPACNIEIPRLTRPPKVTARDATSVSIRWRRWRKPRDKGDGPVTGYFIYYSMVVEGAPIEWKASRAKGYSGKILDLEPDTMYQFMVVPVHESDIMGLGSPPINISTCGAPLTGPTDVHLEETDPEMEGGRQTSVQLKVTWKAPSSAESNCDSITGFRVYMRPPGEETFDFLGVESSTTRTIQNIDPSFNYTVGISSVNNAGLESHRTEITYIGKAGPVQHLRIQPISPTSLRVIWEAPQLSNSPVQFYVLRYKEVRIGNCDVEAAQWSPMIDTDSDNFEQELLDLTPYTEYNVMVWPETKAGEGEHAMETALTPPTAPSGQIQELQGTDLQATSARFRWYPPECEARHGEFLGFKYELRDKSNLGKVEHNGGIVNATELTLRNLIPYTTYILQVWFVNHIGDGPKSDALEFQTLQDKPPAPKDFTIAVRTHSSLTLRWGSPEPPHGIILMYYLKFWTSRMIMQPRVIELASNISEYNMTELQPNTSYGVQIAASTEVGQGDWSIPLYGFTDESLPDEPTNLNNISRSTDSITLQWLDPVKPNGLLLDFHVLCSPMSPLGQYKSRGAEGKVDASTHMYTVQGLQPGTAYVCTVKASTRKGYGPHTRKIFYTMPEDPQPPYIPQFDETKTTDSSITLVLQPNEFESSNTEVSESVYQIVLETLSGTQAAIVKRSLGAANTPCSLPPSQLGGYRHARRTGQGCYITAQISNVASAREFVVGDNKTYGGYFNAPLQKGQSYDVWVGLVVTVDGVMASSYTKSKTPALAAQYIAPEEDGMQMAMMAGAAVGIFLALVLVVLVVLILVVRQRKRKSRPRTCERTESEKLESSRIDTDRDCDRVIFSANHDRYSGASIEEEVDIAETDPLYSSTGINLTRDPISVENLWNVVKEKKSSATEGFRQEYDELPQGLVAKCEESRKPGNKMKNRYGNIVAYDHSRIKLKRDPEDTQSDYINANYIDAYRKPNAYIATQGPSKYTLNDIWLMAWLEHTTRIVMVTNLVEDGRRIRKAHVQTKPRDIEHKCEQYWPDDDSKVYGDISVELMDVEEFADFTIRTFTLTRDGERKTVRQFHFTAWPDHGVPTYATSLLAFRKKVRSFDDPTSGPTIVHCSAGVGRTGTFIALDYLLDQAKVEGQVDIHSCVQQMRTKRVNMVQTQEQYIFVYDALLEALKSGDTSIPCVEFRKRYADLCDINEETNKMKLQEEFELVSVMSPATDVSTCKDAQEPDNMEKNRTQDIIPVDNMSRPYLFTYIAGATDYINAVFVDGYKQRDAFIITQHPLPSTVMDFWTMVYDHDCKTIIMMNEMDSTDESCVEYFPSDKATQVHGPFTVETVSKDPSHDDLTIRDISISCNKRGTETRSVRHFAYKDWPKGQCLPTTKSSLILLLQLLEKWQQRSGNGAIVVHCMDGATQSGLFCAVSYMVERLKVEQEVDVFQSVKHTRVNRPQLVPTLQQYQFVYDMAVEYMDCFETYANFK